MSYPSATERKAVLERLRTVCLALPETIERLSHGAPSFFVRDKKCFLMLLDNHHGDGRFAIWCAAPSGDQQLLVEAGGERFFVPPYVGHRGWLGVRLDRGRLGRARGHRRGRVLRRRAEATRRRTRARRRALLVEDIGRLVGHEASDRKRGGCGR